MEDEANPPAPQYRPPHNEHRNCVKNDIVLKEHVKQSYEESLSLAVSQGKMTNERKASLL